MPKKAIDDEFRLILDQFSKYPAGLTLAKLYHAINQSIAFRTLQRRVANMVMQGSLEKIGSKRGVYYRLKSEREAAQPVFRFSQAAQAILEKVKQPESARRSANYQLEFVDHYHPNHTFYLSESIRHHLATMGNPTGQMLEPAGTYIKVILNRLLLDLSWNSSRLEGNTYSLLETEALLEHGKKAVGKSNFEAKMVLNHKAAIEFLVDAPDEIGFNRYTILNLHALLSDGLLSDPGACGRLRTIPVGISGAVYHPLDIPQLIEEYFQKILAKAASIEDPFEQAFFTMVQLPYLQPFEDVNKRVSRLAANIPFIKHNLSPLSYADVSDEVYVDALLGVYEFNKIEIYRELFVWAYERSAQRYARLRHVLSEPDPFRLQYRDALTEVVNEVVRQKMNKQVAIEFIDVWAREHIIENDQVKFIALTESELMSLHEGNIARYKLRPNEFLRWYQEWLAGRG